MGSALPMASRGWGLHTSSCVRRLALLLPLLLGTRARAEVAEVPVQPADANRGDFWREVITPHADEIASLLQKARNAVQQADGYALTDLEIGRAHV